ncbi:LOW QUALITY PROTEIN: testin [Manduca sexta]|uniref:LOW QUALITY PROTEIN: testin n=1 Tax=Manduca sexta TaxID=7130 RepID=UPI00188E2235|nr:LOW QUALITY PROTEIN: testin [Manduca sexta]
MSESCVETPEAPAWLSKLESQREKLSKARLGHDSGAGAPCNSCGPTCPGLDLHFWRKVCRSCHCSKDVHDVQDDDLSGWAQFELLGTARPKKASMPLIKIRGVTDKPVELDWVPPNASTELVSEYMSCLGSLAPVSGSEAAKRRRAQLRTQLPPHDVATAARHHATDQEKSEHTEYIARIKDHVVGMGNVVRVGPLQNGDVFTIENSKSHSSKSYALPLKISNISRGVKYNIVPKNASDKKLVLDSQGNVVSSAANLPDYKSSPILSRLVKDKLYVMRIESDRIKSAVEHGPVYDKLFKNLNDLNVPVANDVYLQPIKLFRDEYNTNPQFREETNEFCKALGAQIMPDLWSTTNNNVMGNAKVMDSRIQKGTIFAPNGEIWSWKHEPTTPEHSGTICSTKINPQYSTSTKPINQVEPQQTAPLREYLRSHSEDDLPPPPLPNYSTYPGAVPPSNNDWNNQSNDDVQPPDNAGYQVEHQAVTYDDQVSPLIDQLTDFSLSPAEMEFNRKLYNEGVPCQRCKKSMFAGEVAVKADRAGQEAIWHPQCFTCSKCGELLADLVYFYHKGEIYCARDLANVLEIPRCAGCDELIFTRPYTAAEGRAFHVQHFCCYHCDAPLGGKKYVPDDKTGLPVCLSCYDQFYAERCRACGGVIGPEQQGVSWGNMHWHADCFICSGRMCGKSLLSGRFVVKQEMPFCSVPCVQSRIK